MNNDAVFASYYQSTVTPSTKANRSYTVGKHFLALGMAIVLTLGAGIAFALVGMVIEVAIYGNDGFLAGITGLFLGGLFGLLSGLVASVVTAIYLRWAHPLVAVAAIITPVLYVSSLGLAN